jgi:hypothetical protein
VNTCPLCDKSTQDHNATKNLDTAQHLFHECHVCDDLRETLKENIKNTLLTNGLSTYKAAEGTGYTMGDPYFFTGRVHVNLRQILQANGIRNGRTIETIGGNVHSHILNFSAEALKRRSEAIMPDGRHDIKAAWTEQKKRRQPSKGTQTPDTNNKSGTHDISAAGGAGPSNENGRGQTGSTTPATTGARKATNKTQNTQGKPKPERRKGPLFLDLVVHNQGTSRGKKPSTQNGGIKYPELAAIPDGKSAINQAVSREETRNTTNKRQTPPPKTANKPKSLNTKGR